MVVKGMQKTLSFLAIFLTLSINATDTVHWRVNKDHSEIRFKVPYLSISEVTGSFSKFNGWVRFDEDQVLANSIEIHIYASSIFTGNDMRDGHLKSSDFLDVKAYPKIIFKSSKITPIAPSHFLAEGTLQIKELKKPFKIKYTLSEEIRDSWNFVSKFAKFEAQIDREAFGIKWNKSLKDNSFLVGNKIALSGIIQLQPSGKSTPSSQHMIPNTEYIKQRDQLNRGELTKIDSFETTQNLTTTQKVFPKIKKEANQDQTEKSLNTGDPRKQVKWQLAFWLLAFLGFLASLVLGVHAKYFLNNLFQEKYEETGFWGNFSDILAYIYAIAYALAIWYVGWGV